VVAGIKYLPTLAQHDAELAQALADLKVVMKEQKVSEKEVFKSEEAAAGQKRTIISGVRQNLPNYIIRGLNPNANDRAYGRSIGETIFKAIDTAHNQIDNQQPLTMTGKVAAINKNEDPLITPARLMEPSIAAKGVEVTDTYSDVQLRDMGVCGRVLSALKQILQELNRCARFLRQG